VFAVGLTLCDEALVQPVPWSEVGKSYKNSLLKEYDHILETTAREEGIGYIKLWDVLTKADLADGIHPNAAGYEKTYLKIYEAIRHLLT
jgi:lysophospholipase L1-like esterase